MYAIQCTEGLIITKIHKILSFAQKTRLKDYIDFNNTKKKKQTTNLKKKIKRIHNNFYGNICMKETWEYKGQFKY